MTEREDDSEWEEGLSFFSQSDDTVFSIRSGWARLIRRTISIALYMHTHRLSPGTRCTTRTSHYFAYHDCVFSRQSQTLAE